MKDQTNFKARSLETLSQEDRALFEQAIRVRSNAQAPYSHFHVGVAVLSEHGNVYTGCNVERCSYSQTTHAEQNAIDTMIAQEGSVKIKKIAVVAAPQDAEIVLTAKNTIASGSPCGHCRQIIWENCKQDASVPILMLGKNGTVIEAAISDLLPAPFGPADLDVVY